MKRDLKCQDIEFVKGKYRIEVKILKNVTVNKKEFHFSSRSGNYEKFISDFLMTKIEQIEIIEETQK